MQEDGMRAGGHSESPTVTIPRTSGYGLLEKGFQMFRKGNWAGQRQAMGSWIRCAAPLYTHARKGLQPRGLAGALSGPSAAPDFQTAPQKEKQNKFTFSPCA